MTTTVRIMARAWGALVTVTRATEGEVGHNVETQEVELGSHEDRSFDIAPGETVKFEVTHGKDPIPEEQPADEVMTAQTDDDPAGFTDPATGTDPSQVPGQAENDALLGKTAGAEKFDHDGDGKVGGSRKKPRDFEDA